MGGWVMDRAKKAVTTRSRWPERVEGRKVPFWMGGWVGGLGGGRGGSSNELL